MLLAHLTNLDVPALATAFATGLVCGAAVVAGLVAKLPKSRR